MIGPADPFPGLLRVGPGVLTSLTSFGLGQDVEQLRRMTTKAPT